MGEVNNKIIWAKKELEDWHTKHPLKDFPPLALISASKLSETKIEETSSVQGKITNIIVFFPSLGSPCSSAGGLVSVLISLNDKILIPEFLGDNREDSFLFANNISKGDIVRVIVENTDEIWNHSVGIRVEVDEAVYQKCPDCNPE